MSLHDILSGDFYMKHIKEGTFLNNPIVKKFDEANKSCN